MGYSLPRIYRRGLETCAVWQAFAPEFKAGRLTLAAHQANIDQLQPLNTVASNLKDAADILRDERDARLTLVQDLSVRLPDIVEGTLEPDDRLLKEVADVRAIDPKSFQDVINRANRAANLWRNVDAAFAAATPVEPPVVILGNTQAQFEAAILALTGAPALNGSPRVAGLFQRAEGADGDHSEARTALRAMLRRVDSANKRWLSAWRGSFTADSPEMEALSQITDLHGSNRNGGGDEGSGTEPNALGH